MARSHKVSVVYVCVVQPVYLSQAQRFVDSYKSNPPNYPHETIVVFNRGLGGATLKSLFDPLENLTFLNHDNSGYDVGAYQAASRSHANSDLMVFFGSSSFLRGPGWLSRMVEAYEKHGQTLYGVMGHTGDLRVGVHPHIRTTGFWIPPVLFNQYPYVITTARERYPFEHGNTSLTNWICAIGLTPWVVTWDGEYTKPDWGNIPNGYRHGAETGLLCGDRLNLPPYWAGV